MIEYFVFGIMLIVLMIVNLITLCLCLVFSFLASI